MEDDAGFQDGDVDHVWIGAGGCCVGVSGSLDAAGTGLGLVPLDETVAGVFDQEGEEKTSHKNGSGRCFVGELAEAFVLEHESGVREELPRKGLAPVDTYRRPWSLTWTKAVEMMTPVPNCLRIVKTACFGET